MVAIVSGSGLGLFGTTAGLGSPNTGRGGERVFVNTATGNLVIQGVDETLIARGLDLALVRTYNSQGLLNDDNGDNWRLGVHRRLYALSGEVNTVGSTITKVFGDAAEVVYSYDEATGRYVSTEGDGAHDTLAFSVADSEWMWTDESSRSTETYDSQGRVTESLDSAANLVSYIYTGARLTQIFDASGQQTFLDYTGNNLQQIRVVSDGATQTLTRYGYDLEGRLSTVTLDLSPEDNAIADGDVYVTTYTYDGMSHRVASVTQTDGSSCAFTYQLIDDEYRVHTYTDGEGRVTTLEYSQATGGGGGGPQGVEADEDVLLETEVESVTTQYELDEAAVETTDAQFVTTEAELDDASLSTTDTESVEADYELDDALLTTNGTQTLDHERNEDALIPTGALTITTNYSLILGQLTPAPGGSWDAEESLSVSGMAYDSSIAYANNGDAVAAWRDDETVYVRRYLAATDSWQSAVGISAGESSVSMLHLAVDSVTGSAAIAWTQGLDGAESLFMSYMDSAGTWTAATSAESGSGAVTPWLEQFDVSVAGTHAAVAFVQEAGGNLNVYLTRMNNGVASAAALVDSLADEAQFPSVAIDSTGNATVLWRQGSSGSPPFAYQRRWNAATQSFSDVTLLASADGVRFPQVAFDAQGNGIAIWRQAGGLHARHFNVTTDTWGAAIALQSLANDAFGFRLAVDGEGNALVGWVQADGSGVPSMYANRYSVSTGSWVGATLLETASAQVGTDHNIAVAINGEKAVASWFLANGADADVYATRFADGLWSAPVLMDSRSESPACLSVGIDAQGAVGVAWVQADESALHVRSRQFVPVDDGGPYYTVPPAATWQSLANALYGIDSVAAGAALQAAMGNPPLTTGAQMSGWPAVLSFTSTTSNHTLDVTELTSSAGGSWETEEMLESSNVPASDSHIGYANSGDAVAAWRQGNSVHVRRYIAATNSWQAAVAISAGASGVTTLHLAVDAVTGSAAIAWSQESGGVQSLFMSYMDASGNWTEATAAESGSGAVEIGTEQFSVSAAGAYAAVTFVQTLDGERNVYLTRMNAGTASSAALVDHLATEAQFPTVAIDASGNASVVWRQSESIGAMRAYHNRWNATTQSFSGAVLLDTDAQGSRFPQIAFDAQGNGIAVWRQSGGIHARHFNMTTGSWGAAIALQSLTNTAGGFRLAVDSDGNALVGWLQNDGGGISSIYANRYSAASGAWGGATLLETSNVPVSAEQYVAVAINGDRAVASWLQTNGTNSDVYTARFANGLWSTPQLMESRQESPSNLSGGIDAEGRIGLVWIQADGQARSPWIRQFENHPPHYFVPAGATWQSIANTLYNIDSAIAGAALQAAMGNPALTEGAQLSGWPAVLTCVPAATAASGPSYYLVPAGATWQSIANSVYGVNSAAAGAALQSVLGNPALTTGAQLTGFPATLPVVMNLAPHYVVPAGATWRSIANTLYGVDSNEAGAALQAALGDPQLNTGALLFGLPATLTAATVTTVTVAPYHVIAEGDTWESIAAQLYGTAAAASALQTALGNPALTPGNRLTGLPEELSVTVETTVTVPPYYVVQGEDSWESIATLLYGSPAVLPQLRDFLGNPTLAAGLRLDSLPDSFGVTTEVTVNVPPYYLVQEDDDWSGIALAVYGTDDANAVQALRDALPGVTLAEGLHLAVPPTLSYIPVNGGSATLYLTTEIEDSLGFLTTLQHDSAGRLARTQGPATDGIRPETRYFYDTEGNLTSTVEDPTGLGRATTFEYDDNGNLALMRDATGNTVSRTYDANNQLLTESRYRIADPDGAGGSPALEAMTAHYVYDTDSQLRFTISAEGRVAERRYATNGQLESTFTYTGGLYSDTTFELNDLEGWAAEQNLTRLQRADYTYDFRGNVQSVTTWAATDPAGEGTDAESVTQFVYDQRGRLLQTIDALGVDDTPDPADASVPHSTTFTYDGLGRVLTVTEWESGDGQRTTLNSYDDANRRTSVTLESGLITTSQFNAAGELIAMTQGVAGDLDSLGATSYAYDANGRLRMATDPVGGRTFNFYDNFGRRVALVDADGTLTEFIYDGASAVVKTVQYAVRLDTATLASLVNSGVPQDVPVASLRDAAGGTPAADRILRSVYDAAGRLVFSIDAEGAVTQFFYDGAGRLTDEVRFATRVVVAAVVDALDAAAVEPMIVGTAADRRTRHFYDADGNEIATLDSAGYLVEYLRDSAGALRLQIGYATRTAAQYWSAGSLEQLRPAPDADDARSHFFHDAQGRQIGVLDAEGYFSETVYDVAGHVASTSRYEMVVAYVEGASTFASVRAVAQAGAARTSSFAYDGLGRVVRETNHQGTVTSYEYDEVGNLVSVTRALATVDERSTATRYDLLGRVVQELTAEGRALITAGLSQPAIDDIWSRYGASYVYDEAGRRISATVRPNDTQTQTTLFFYDADGRLRFEVNALGEVRETRYDAFGQATETVAYVNRIDTGSLVGGAVSEILSSRIAAAADAVRDSHTLAGYTRRGQVASTATSEGASVAYEYDAFGATAARVQHVDATRNLRHEYAYDTRGQLTLTAWDPSGLNTTEVRTYDAFGRTVSVTDALGNTSEFEYDRLGRQIVAIDALGVDSHLSYDAFSRTVRMADGLGNETTFRYDDDLRTSTVVTPEGIEVVTTSNRHGQTQRVVAAGRTTQYLYDLNGGVLESFDDLGSSGTTAYDRAGRVILTTNVAGVTTTMAYDAANRVLSRTVESPDDDLVLLTEYVYDGQGRVTQVAEPGGRVTQTNYDRDGRIVEVVVDPAGLNLRVSYAYDHMGRVIDTIEGVGGANPRHVRIEFDMLGRRVSETVDPLVAGVGLNLVTQYRYDAGGNLTRKIDAAGNSTWFVYDSVARLRYTVDALGGVSEMVYDDAGRVIATGRFATAVEPYAAPSPFGDVVTLSEIAPLLAASSEDRISQSVFDRDGREVFTINALGGVTERTFDANGNVTRTRLYVEAIAPGAYLTVEDVHAALVAANNDLTYHAAADRVGWTVYDLRGRAVFAIDGLGGVTRSEFDLRGNIVATTRFAALRDMAAFETLAAMQAWAATATVANDAANRTTRYWYDGLDRLRFTLDAEGYLFGTAHDDAARAETSIGYAARPVAVAETATLDAVEAIADALRDVSADRFSESRRDVAGRVVRVYDAENLYEEYGYDAVGNRTSLRNKAGAVWSYVYDANHRLVEEHSPVVSIASVMEAGGHLVTGTDNASIVTRMAYDALGNVASRTEAHGRSEARTTTYEYDALGRQTRTTFPDISVYYAPADDVTRGGADVVRSEVVVAPYSQVTYDILGNAVVNRDLAGSYTHNAYDALGRLVFTVDALGYITEKSYDTFGNVVRLTRHLDDIDAEDLEPGARWSAAEIRERFAVMDSDLIAGDRTIFTEYDRLNRAVRVWQDALQNYEPAVGSLAARAFVQLPTTVNDYNALGDLVRVRGLVGPDPSSFAATYQYYDREGRRTATVDALGYLTTYQYDAAGNETRRTEFVTALDAGSWNLDTYATPAPITPVTAPDNPLGYDRVIEHEYDRLGRVTSETLVGIQYSTFNGAALEMAIGDQRTAYGYDALGNRTRVQAANGATTYTYYDVLGRTVAATEAERDPGDGVARRPLARYEHDVFGNLVKEVRYANAAMAASETGFLAPAAHIQDRHTVFQLDSYGNIVRAEDASHANRYASYTVRGDAAKEWQPVADVDGGLDTLVTVREFDLLGRQTALIEPQRLGDAAAQNRIARFETVYNPFGEIESQGGQSFAYDRGGRVTLRSEDGVTHAYLYNLAGKATADITARSRNVRSYSPSELASFLLQSNPDFTAIQTGYDLLGRALPRYLPSFSAPVSQVDPDAVRAIVNGFAIGDVDMPANPDAVFRIVYPPTSLEAEVGAVPRGSVSYVFDPGATIAQGGGYYFNGTTYARDPAQRLIATRAVYWDAPADHTASLRFEYRPSADVNAVWQSIDVVRLPNNQVGVSVESLALGDYQFRVRYTRHTQVTHYAEASGTFSITGSQQGATALQPDLIDDSNVVEPLRPGTGGEVQAEIVYSAPLDHNSGVHESPENGYGYGYGYGYGLPSFVYWYGENEVRVAFPGHRGAVTVELQYYTEAAFNAVSEYRRLNFHFADASDATDGLTLQWADQFGTRESGRISAIAGVRVFDAAGNLLYDTTGPVSSTRLVWQAPEVGVVTPIFNARRNGTLEWTALAVGRSGPDFVVDTKGLVPGQWEYEITYFKAENEITARASGMIEITASDVVSTLTDLEARGPDANPPLQGVNTPSSIQIHYSFGPPYFDSETQQIVAGPIPDTYAEARWQGTNQLNLEYPSIGSGSEVRVVVEYERSPYYVYTPGQIVRPAGVPSYSQAPFMLYERNTSREPVFQEFILEPSPTGAQLNWNDPYFGQDGGVARILSVKVYTHGLTEPWELQHSFDGRVPVTGRAIYWPVVETIDVDTPELQVRALGAADWVGVAITREQLPSDYTGVGARYQVARLDSFAEGEYEYRLTRGFAPPGATGPTVGAGGVSFGRFSIADSTTPNAAAGSLSILEQHNTVVDGVPGSSWIAPVYSDGTSLNWTLEVVGEFDYFVVNQRAEGATDWASSEVIQSAGYGNADYSIALQRFAGRQTEFEITWFALASDGSGQPFSMDVASGATTGFGPTRLVGGAARVLSQGQTLAVGAMPIGGLTTVGWGDRGPNSVGNNIRWNQPAEEGATVQFRYRFNSQEPWSTATVNEYVAGYVVDALTIPLATFEYELTYTRAGETEPYAIATGHGSRYTFASGGTPEIVVDSVLEDSVLIAPALSQVVDRWGNTLEVRDPLGATTNYRFNHLNQLVQTTLPAVSIVSTENRTVNESSGRPEMRNFYDSMGRPIATQDANGNVMRVVYNAAGQVLQELHEDGGVVRHRYDLFGQEVETTDELGYERRSEYDALGRLTRIEREVAADAFANGYTHLILSDTYGYDAAGRRIRETNGEEETTSYRYDLHGNVIERRTPLGHSTRYEYNEIDLKIREQDANGQVATWSYDDLSRRLNEHSDFGGFRTIYGYDNAGHVLEEVLLDPTSEQIYSKEHNYDAAGNLFSIYESNVGVADESAPAQVRVTTYAYDSLGRRIFERTFINGEYQNTSTTYDAAGRLARVIDNRFDIAYSYDAQGNRTRILATYVDQRQQPVVDDLWYSYDGMNRMVLSQAVNTDGSLAIDIGQGIELTYNVGGQRIASVTYGKAIHRRTTGGNPGYYMGDDYVRESYHYDGVGRLVDTFQLARVVGPPFGDENINTEHREYDRASREVLDRIVTVDKKGQNRLTTRERTTTYDLSGRPLEQATTKDGERETTITYGISNEGGTTPGFDAAGVLRGYDIEFFDPDAEGRYRYRTTHTFQYMLRDGYLETNHKAVSSDPGNAFRRRETLPTDAETTHRYSANGELIAIENQNDHSLDRHFINNASGQALVAFQSAAAIGSIDLQIKQDYARVRFGNALKTQYFFFANGQFVGQFGQFNKTDADGAPVFEGKFDVNFEPISSGYPSAAPSEVVAQAGDTLRTIAARMWGDASLWYLIADENGLSDPEAELTPGLSLRIPNQVVTLANNAQTFKPFNPTEAIGDTTPVQPPPKPAQRGCGIIGTILLAVVAIVVTVYTAGVAANAFASLAGGTVTGGSALSGTLAVSFGGTVSAGASTAIGIGAAAVGGAAASAVTQGLLIATGHQESFDWKGVALGAIGAGVTSGLGFAAKAFGNSGGLLSAALSSPTARGVIGNALTQGIGVAVKAQDSFSWRDVAISGVAAAAAGVTSKFIGGANPGATRAFLTRVAGGAVGSAVRMGFHGKVDVASVLADAFGNVLGDSLAEAMMPTVEPPATRAVRGSGGSGDGLDEVVVTARESANPDNNPGGEFSLNLDVTKPSPDEIREGIARYGGVDETFRIGQEGKRGWWGVAQSQLGAGASDAQIQARALQLMTANPGVEILHEGDLVNTAGGAIDESARQAYASRDSIYQTERFADSIERAQLGANELQFDSAPTVFDELSGSRLGPLESGVAPINAVNTVGAIPPSRAPIDPIAEETNRMVARYAPDEEADMIERILSTSIWAADKGGQINLTTTTIEETRFRMWADGDLARDFAFSTDAKYSFGGVIERGMSRSTTHALEAGMTGGFFDATGTTRYTKSLTSAIGSTAFRSTVGFLGHSYVGGVFDVGFNFLEGEYDLYEPTPREKFANVFSIAYDFGTGTAKSYVAGTAGVSIGTAVTAAVALTGVAAPVAPAVGIAAGAGTAFAVDIVLSEWVIKPVKPIAVRVALAGYDAYQYVEPYHHRAIDITSRKLVEPVMKFFGQ